MRGVRLLHSKNQSPLQCDAGLEPDSCALIFFPPFPGVLNFLVFFLKWQVSYPTLNKIKTKQNNTTIHWERQIGQHFYKKKIGLKEHGTVNACMTSLTERAQG